MKRLLAIPLFVLCLVSAALAQAAPANVTLGWITPTNGAYPLSALSGYNLSYGTNSSALTNFTFVTNSMTMNVTGTVSNLTRGYTWYFSVNALGTNGLGSVASSQVSTNLPVPPPPPTGLIIISVQ